MFLEHRSTLWCIAASVLSDRAHADDVVQEAAAISLTKLDQFDPGTSFPAWVGQIVRFVALNELRRRQRQRASAVDPDVINSTSVRTEQAPSRPLDIAGRLVPEQTAFDDQVAGALGQLDEVARSCLLLRTVREMQYNEIAAILGIPEGTAMSHVHRARATMRRALTEASHGREARA